ncbi:IclR family transcriptional regulator [Pelagibius sp.]|uniref:IclR family transcriptional regulator n=1 Tax=Pelagibius sp. TaxID=1931238 RepID=UPI003B50BDE9
MAELKRGRSRTRTKVEITRTLDRGLRVLEVIADEASLSLSEIARRLDLTPATTFRLLETLRHRDYVRQDEETGLYDVGPRAFQIGSAFTERLRIHQVAQPVLGRLADELGDTVSLGLRDGGEVIFVDQREGRGMIRMAPRLGVRAPLHCTAAGKVLTAWLWEAALRDVLGDRPMERFTESTIASWPALIEELDRVRQQGYAMDLEEYEQQICCLAAPVRGRDGHVVGALSVSRVATRFPHSDPLPFAQRIIAAAEDVSRRLGWTGGAQAPVHHVSNGSRQSVEILDD